MSSHKDEVEVGRVIDQGTLTAYRCLHNHVFYVVGPHVWCACGKVIGYGTQSPVRPKILCLRGGGVRERPYYTDMIHCRCGANTRGPARFSAATLRAAATAHMIGGVEAAARILAMPPVAPRVETVSGVGVELFAANFPINTVVW